MIIYKVLDEGKISLIIMPRSANVVRYFEFNDSCSHNNNINNEIIIIVSVPKRKGNEIEDVFMLKFLRFFVEALSVCIKFLD